MRCHSGTQSRRIFRIRKWLSAHSASFSTCRWGQITIKHLLGEQMPSLSTVAKLQFDFVSINGIFKVSTELKGIRMNIYWGSYWNWQARIVYLELGKRETSTDDRELLERLPKLLPQVSSAFQKNSIYPTWGFIHLDHFYFYETNESYLLYRKFTWNYLVCKY